MIQLEDMVAMVRRTSQYAQAAQYTLPRSGITRFARPSKQVGEASKQSCQAAAR